MTHEKCQISFRSFRDTKKEFDSKKMFMTVESAHFLQLNLHISGLYKIQSLPSNYFKDLTHKWRWLNCCNFSQNIHRIIQLDKQATTDMSYPAIMKCEKDLYFLRLVNLHFLLKSSKVQVLFHLSKRVKKVWCLSVAQE